MSPHRAGALAVIVALAVAAGWYATRAKPIPPRSLTESTMAIAVTKHDAFGAPSKPTRIVDHARIEALLAALGTDHPVVACPADYATANVGLLLSGADVYARKNAYVWDLQTSPRVVFVDETGCRGGPVANANALRAGL